MLWFVGFGLLFSNLMMFVEYMSRLVLWYCTENNNYMATGWRIQKSNYNNYIDVERKIMSAYCPTKEEEKGEKSAADVEDAGTVSMQLKEVKIKNPCLDNLENIIFSPPDSVFLAGGTTYTSFTTVREKFLAGEISEENLKRGLIDALNKLLEPVRNHLATDENAKDLLSKVRQYKKESLPKVSIVRRLSR